MTQPDTIQRRSLAELARQMHAWGANVSVIKPGTKAPHTVNGAWQHWQSERQTVAELDALLSREFAAIGAFQGPGGWRAFDIDAAEDDRMLLAALAAIGLPSDYQWSYRSGSGAGWGFFIRCDEPLPAEFASGKGVVRGAPLPGYAYDHLELRWQDCQTIISGAHPTGPGYRWRRNSSPVTAPALIPADRIIAAFTAIATVATHAPAPVATARPRSSVTDSGELAGVVDCLDYARRFIPGQEQATGGDLRWAGQGYGGLLFTQDGRGWYCHLEQTGGALPDLIAWHRGITVEEARALLHPSRPPTPRSAGDWLADMPRSTSWRAGWIRAAATEEATA